MFNIDNWHKRIYKDDLVYVLINAFAVVLLGGIIAGSIDYLFSLIKVNISFGLIIITLILGIRIRKSYYNFHILYPVLSIPFMILAIFISTLTEWVYLFGIQNFCNILLDPAFYLNFVEQPVYYIVKAFNPFDGLVLVLGIVDTLIYIWSFYFCYRLAKGNN